MEKENDAGNFLLWGLTKIGKIVAVVGIVIYPKEGPVSAIS